MRGAETVTVLPAGGRDSYGDPTGGDAAGRDIPGCLVADGADTERVSRGRDTVTSDFVVYTPTGEDLDPLAQLEVRGRVCEIVGRPFVWRRGNRDVGTVIRANVVEG